MRCNVRAQDLQDMVASRLRDEHRLDLEPDLPAEVRRGEDMVAPGCAHGKHALRSPGQGVRQKVLELAHLVSAVLGVGQVVTLHPEFTVGRGERVDPLDRSRVAPERQWLPLP